MIIALICLIYCIAPAYQISDEELASVLEPARVLDWNKMVTGLELFKRLDISKKLIHFGFSAKIVEVLIKNGDMNHWPSGLVSYYLNKTRENDNRADDSLLDRYKCKRVPGDREAVIVFYDQNTTLPKEMKAYPGFIVLFDDGGVDQSPFTYEINLNAHDLQRANCLKPVKVTKWHHFLPEPSTFRIIQVMKELQKFRFSPEMVEVLIYNSKMEHWPAGLVSYLNNEDVGNRSLDIYEYKCKRIPGEQEAVIVFNFDNPRMSEEMKVNPGFIVLFDGEAIKNDKLTIEIEELIESVKKAKFNFS